MAMETTTTLKPETLEALQELIQINIDSRDGFLNAAEQVEQVHLRELFATLSVERESQATELQQFVQANAEQPRREGSVAATLHRGWMSIRASLESNDAHAALAEAERGEDQIKGRYEELIRETAGSAVNDVLVRHYSQVKTAHDRIRDLRDSWKDS